jgi:hypothetical protein
MNQKKFEDKVLDEMRDILKEKKNSSKKIEDLIYKERSFLDRTNAGDFWDVPRVRQLVDDKENIPEDLDARKVAKITLDELEEHQDEYDIKDINF